MPKDPGVLQPEVSDDLERHQLETVGGFEFAASVAGVSDVTVAIVVVGAVGDESAPGQVQAVERPISSTATVAAVGRPGTDRGTAARFTVHGRPDPVMPGWEA
ncbi:MAG: hypothetical protein QNJ88_05560 [Acidimicrobiia bacterium]|nr:hypothetical protein [Acidimicrobiia bacterium]